MSSDAYLFRDAWMCSYKSWDVGGYSPTWIICAVVSPGRHRLKRWSENDSWEHRKIKIVPFNSTRTRTFTDVKQQYTPVWRFRFEGPGNAVVFVLSEHCVSSWVSMLVEEWGLQRPPSLKVFHRGESSDTHGIQGVCRLCLWRRWNTVLGFYREKVNWQNRHEVVLRCNCYK